MPTDCLSVGVLVADHVCAPIDHLPVPGELILTDELRLTIGGCASNAATDMARLGVEVGVVGCVGDDVFGKYLIEALYDRGVDTRLIRQVTGVGTSASLIVNVRGQDRRFIHTFGANAHLKASDIPWDEVRQTRVFYVGGYLLAPNLEQDGLAELFRQARAAGVVTVLDVVMPDKLNHWPALEKLLPHTDVFLPNDDEGLLLTGLADPCRQAERFYEAGAKTVVITCGELGTVMLTKDLKLRAEVFDVPFVGGTGAGDAFVAGYVAALLQDLGPEQCLAWGSALGASCVRSIGATESVFTRDEAEEFLRENRLKTVKW